MMWAKLPATIILTTTAALTACTPGQTEFSCKGHPDGVACISARDVYDLTNSRSRVTQADLENPAVIDGSVAQDILKPLPNSDPRLNLAPSTQAGQRPADPAEGVMRVWVGPHVTAAGDVAAPNYVYSQVGRKPARPTAQIERRFEPLTGQSEPIPASNARPLEAGDVIVAKQALVDSHVAMPKQDPNPIFPTKNAGIVEIYFESGRADVSARGRRKLEVAAQKIAKLQPKTLLVSGFTDAIGSKEANQKLAEKRSTEVGRILTELGVKTHIIKTTKADVIDLSREPDSASDPNKRRVRVLALDVKQQPAAVIEPPAAISTLSNTPEKEPSPPAVMRKAASNDNDGTRPCRLCRDTDDNGSSDHDGRDHDNGMHH